LLGGVRVGARDGGRATSRARRAADGGHVGVHGADAGGRPGPSHHATVGGHSPPLLAGSWRGAASLLGGACGRDRPPVSHDLCGPASGHPAIAVYARESWRAGIVAVMIMFPHLLWLAESGDGVLNVWGRLRAPESVVANFSAWLKQGVFILGSHAGLAVLVALG